MKKFNYRAFTLAEVLITLVVIGVVAAMTMMIIIPSVNEAQTVSRVKHAYSVFSQAYLKAKLQEGPPEFWDIGTEDSQYGAQQLYKIFKPHLVRSKDCELNVGCFADGDYLAMDGKTKWAWNPRLHVRDTKGVLANGTSFALWSGGTGCNLNSQADQSEDGLYSNTCAGIHIDINGAKKPNRAGYDLFTLAVTPNGIVPDGLSGFKSKYGDECVYGSNKNTNGNACIGWILAKGNMDYTRRDISNEL